MCLQHFTTQVTLPSSLAERAKTSDKGTTALGEAFHSIVCLVCVGVSSEPQKPASSTMSRPVMLNERNHQLCFPRVIFFSSDANDRSADLYQIIDLIPQMLQYCSYHQVAKTWIFTDNIFLKNAPKPLNAVSACFHQMSSVNTVAL